jgi:hypothetical protein
MNREHVKRVVERTVYIMFKSSLLEPARVFCNAGKCRTTSRRWSICVTREDAVRAELASRVSFEASCSLFSGDEDEWD